MEKNTSEKELYTNRKTNITKAKEERKLLKQKYNAICKTKNNQQINNIKTQYIISQQMTRKLIEKEIKNRYIKHISKIITEGAWTPVFWKIRKRLLGIHNRDAKDEDGKITNPTIAKEHIATYYEDLYQLPSQRRGGLACSLDRTHQ